MLRPRRHQTDRTGGFDQDAGLLGDADWIVEAVRRITRNQTDAAVASGPACFSGRSPSRPTHRASRSLRLRPACRPRLRRGWLGTLFNPPRYLRLLDDSDAATAVSVVEQVSDFADRRPGKGIVLAKDTPGFIANRLGIFGALRSIELVASGEFTIEEVDAITGPIRPAESATFRTMDIAGVDILAKVAATSKPVSERTGEADARRACSVDGDARTRTAWRQDRPGFLRARPRTPVLRFSCSIQRRWIREPAPVKLTALEAAGAFADTGARIRGLLRVRIAWAISSAGRLARRRLCRGNRRRDRALA